MQLSPDELVDLVEKLRDLGVSSFKAGDLEVTMGRAPAFVNTLTEDFSSEPKTMVSALGDEFTDEELYGLKVG